MDDCNEEADKVVSRARDRSDSSMDDCNIKDVSVKLDRINVQIPLWTIVTCYRHVYECWMVRSDSSMDDCNGLLCGRVFRDPTFRFLYGRL